jgi:lycopene cyclase domain-containing protein
MATYLVLNASFILAVCAVLARQLRRPTKPWYITLAVLVVLTIIFDNILILLDAYSYEPSKLLGIYIGVMPIEDLMYALLAAILIPSLWQRLGVHHAR